MANPVVDAVQVGKTHFIGFLPEQINDVDGLAAIINEEAFDDLDAPIVRITALDTPVPFSPPQEERFLPKLSDVVEKARWLKAY